jgi:hypothetical protein
MRSQKTISRTLVTQTDFALVPQISTLLEYSKLCFATSNAFDE